MCAGFHPSDSVQETDGSGIKAHICFGTWKWKRWPDAKTMLSLRRSRSRAITDSVESARQSQSAYCLSDICFTLYKLQMALAASGKVIKLYITTMAGLCLRIFAVTSVLCTSWINDDPRYYDLVLTCCVHSQYECCICGVLIMWQAKCPIERDWYWISVAHTNSDVFNMKQPTLIF